MIGFDWVIIGILVCLIGGIIIGVCIVRPPYDPPYRWYGE